MEHDLRISHKMKGETSLKGAALVGPNPCSVTGSPGPDLARRWLNVPFFPEVPFFDRSLIFDNVINL